MDDADDPDFPTAGCPSFSQFLKIIVAQKGAREHYAVARALHRQGMLAGLVTDWYAFGKQKSETLKTENLKTEKSQRLSISGFQRAFQHFSISAFQHFSGRGHAALASRAEGIPDELVRAFPFRSLLWKRQVRRLAAQGRSHEAYVQTDSAFAAAVAKLKLSPHDVYFGYSYASLEMLAAEKKRGVMTVLDQIDPSAVEFRLVAEEMARFPELAGPPPPFPAAYYERNQRESELADVIVVNSEWSRQALVSEGVNTAKIEVLPLAYEMEDGRWKMEDRTQKRGDRSWKVEDRKAPNSGLSSLRSSATAPVLRSSTAEGGEDGRSPISDLRSPSPLRVLWLGQVNVRKGIHYLIEAARLLEHENIHFDVVGPIGILPGAVASTPRNMTLHGPVSRDRAAEWYRQADVFVLPTLSDGFALTQLEALAHGLPVIATPNCGRVVEDGVTGFIVPPRDPRALANAILRFVHKPGLAQEMAAACREAAKAFSIDACGKRLIEIIRKSSANMN